jgi:type IV pilus assembly protein PilW
MDFLARDIRVADFWGCMRNDSGGPTNFIDPAGSDYDATIHAFFSAGGLVGTQGAVDAGGNFGLDASDTITIRGLSSQGEFLSVVPGGEAAALTVIHYGSGGQDFAANDFLLVTDCNNGDIFQASSVAKSINTTPDPIETTYTISHATGGSPGNTGDIGDIADPTDDIPPGDFSKVYGTDALVHKISTITYSIEDIDGDGITSLYRSINDDKKELIEGVENMQVLYGIDTDDPNPDGVPNFYVPFDSIPANIPVGGGNPPGTDRIVSIRISFLLLSIDNNIAPKNVSVAYNGGTSTADRRLRKVVTSIINLRNR